MNSQTFQNISKIIERDSKTTTYKFALLRGVIEIIQENSPYINIENGRATFQTGLLIEKWVMYYYPILESSLTIPQINGINTKIAFDQEMKNVIHFYRDKGGCSALNNDLKKGLPKEVEFDFSALVKKLRYTITKMPMKYIGKSIDNMEYSIFQYSPPSFHLAPRLIDSEYIIESYGSFSIPIDYYDAFRLLGSFIGGSDSILVKWAEFSSRASGGVITVDKVIHEVLKGPITDRDVLESKKLYKSVLETEGNVRCVWSDKKLSNYDIDHVIPFSVWKNNDLWNLLPSSSLVNNRKRDKIPSPDFLEYRKSNIIQYWDLINEYTQDRFQKEIRIALLGRNDSRNWKDIAFKQLKSSCNYLINQRGFESWKL